MGGQPLAGPSGPNSLVGVNVLPGDTSSTGSLATVDLLTGDGTVVQVALPTTTQQVQQGLAPVGNLAGALLGEQTGAAVTNLTNGLAPVVATVTSTVDQVATPVLNTVNGALSPLTGTNGILTPVTGVVSNVVGGLAGSAGDPTSALGGNLLGANIGGNAVTGPTSANTLVGVNLLPGGSTAPAQGQLVTAEVLTQGTILNVTVPTTAAGVQAGLQPVGNLAGTLLGPQAGAVVNQVTTGLAPVVAGVTAPLSQVTTPLLDAVNNLAPALPTGGGAGTGAGTPLAPVTNLLGGLLGRGN